MIIFLPTYIAIIYFLLPINIAVSYVPLQNMLQYFISHFKYIAIICFTLFF